MRRFTKHKKIRWSLSVIFLLLFCQNGYGQDFTPYKRPSEEALEQKKADVELRINEIRSRQQEVKRQAEELDIPLVLEFEGVYGLLVDIYDGHPRYVFTENEEAAQIITVDDARNDHNLTGAGETLHIWDGGEVRVTHELFDGNGGSRVTQVEASTLLGGDHATHVAGTMIGDCPPQDATGMAFEAELRAFDFDDDQNEILNESINLNVDLLVSNHSYGLVCGWRNGVWWGDPGDPEDRLFGQYNAIPSFFDEVMYDNPFYIVVRSAGNDRDDAGPGNPGEPEQDGGIDGFDCLPPSKTSKNAIVVGSIDGMSNVSDFSSFGPTDDGRIKPDILAQGLDVKSGNNTGDKDYFNTSGTSMAAPGISGGIGLLLEHQRNLYGNIVYRSSTTKGLLLHTATDRGNVGPDYSHGWGRANFSKAADLMEKDAINCTNIREYTMNNGDEIHFDVLVNPYNAPLNVEQFKATICWTDPEHAPLGNFLNNNTSVLINDIDLRVTKYDGTEFQPWVLDPANPGNPATKGDNVLDNVEQVVIPNSEYGLFRISLSHKGTLVDDNGNTSSQVVSVIVNGLRGGFVIPTINPVSGTLSSSNMQGEYATDLVHSDGVNQVSATGEVLYASGYEVSLRPGFTAQSGSDFRAVIFDHELCQSGSFDVQSDQNEEELLGVNDRIETAEEPLYRTLDIYPNPASESITVIAPSDIQLVRVLDMNGKEMLSRQGSGTEMNLNLVQLESANYIIEVTTESGVTTESFQKL